MEICGLSIAVGKDGREYILSSTDCTFALMGDTQEDDRRQIAELVVSRMQNVCRPAMAKPVSRSSVSSRGSPTDENPSSVGGIGSRPPSVSGVPPPIPERSTPGPGSIGRHGSLGSVSSDLPEQPTERAPTLSSVGRRDSQGDYFLHTNHIVDYQINNWLLLYFSITIINNIGHTTGPIN